MAFFVSFGEALIWDWNYSKKKSSNRFDNLATNLKPHAAQTKW
jgi:hypothetical protein